MRSMYRRVLSAFILAFSVVGLSLASPTPAQARVSVAMDFFHDDLAPYGQWVDVNDYGRCWVPRHVRTGWRPYLDGRWVFTDYGWTG